MPKPISRRTFLAGALVGTGATLGVPTAMSAPRVRADAATAQFEGPNQRGVLLGSARRAVACSFDITAENRAELVALFQTVTDRMRTLYAGGRPDFAGPAAPPADNGVLGPNVPSRAVNFIVGVGGSLFDERYGLGRLRPSYLPLMPTFPNDNLNPGETHGDLSLIITGDEEDTVLHALRDIARHTRGGMQLRWRIDGFSSPPRPSGTPRNLLGFKDGISNPDIVDPSVREQMVFVDEASTRQSWTAGGSFQVIRIIRMLVEFWDRVSINEQELMFGRRKATGAPLTGNSEYDIPNYTEDPQGFAIPLDSHIRLANPRTPKTAQSRILRRGYNYDRGIDANGNLDMGLIFTCYQQDLRRQFEATQRRLFDEPLVDYISPTGGGYFLALPGVSGAADYFGRTLLEA